MTIHDLKKMLSFEVKLFGPKCPLSYAVRRLREETQTSPLTGLQDELIGDWMLRTWGGYTRNDF